MGLKEIIDRLEPKIIQYLTIEKEVVEEIYKELFAGTLKRDEWNDYYISIVEKVGDPIMIEMIKGFREIQDLTVEHIGKENITEHLKDLMKINTETKKRLAKLDEIETEEIELVNTSKPLYISSNELDFSLVNNKIDWKQSVMKEAENIINQLRGYFQAEEDESIKDQLMKMLDKLEMIIKA